jgi:replicative DNA helicase
MPETLPDRLPPYNADAEAAVLGAALLDPAALDLVVERMRADDFFRNAHARVFEAIKALSLGRGPVDLVTVQGWLASRNLLEAVGGPVGLARLTEMVASASNVEAYINIVLDAAQLRRVIAAAAIASQAAFEPGAEASKVADQAAAIMLDAADHRASSRPEDAGAVVMRTIELIQNYEQQKAIDHPTGFKALDDILLGFHAGEMTIVAARPGMGKTALCMNFAVELGVMQGKPGAVFSLEMPADQVMLRVVSSMSSVDLHTMRSGRLLQQDRDRVTRAAEALSKAPMYFTNPGQMDLDGIRASLRRLRRERGITWAVVDYLQKIPSGLRRVDTRAQEVGYISRTLSLTGLDLGIRMIVAAQLNRESVRGNGEAPSRRPRVSDLRDSGEIEQDANNVLMIWRDQVEEGESAGDEAAEIIVGKQRQGRTGTAHLVWQGRFVRFAKPYVQQPVPTSSVHSSDDRPWRPKGKP